MHTAIYFPTHHSKLGEINAVGHLSPHARTRIRPTFGITKPRADNDDPIEYHLSDLATDFARSWGTALPIFFDFPRYGPDERINDGRHPVEYFFDCVRQLRIPGIPVAGPESIRGPGYAYLEAIARIASRDGRGAAVRIPHRELNRPNTLGNSIDDTLKALSLLPADVDLFLDLEALTTLPLEEQSENNLIAVITDALQAIRGMPFRNVILSGSSIPDQVGRKYNWNPLRVARTELKVWITLIQREWAAHLKFGDNGVTYAYDRDIEKTGPPPCRIRLSTEAEHLLCRAPRGNYRKLSNQVVKRKEFDPELPAWGIGEIGACGSGTGSEGSPTSWVARDTNVHLEGTARFVERSLAKHGRLTNVSFANPEIFPWLQSQLGASLTR